MDKRDIHFSSHFSDLIKINPKACSAKYRKDTPSTITVHSSVYSIETYYADFYNRSEKAINQISPDFLKRMLRKDLNVYTFNELVKEVVSVGKPHVSSLHLLTMPILDPKDKILKDCPIYGFKDDNLLPSWSLRNFLDRAWGTIMVSSLKKGKNLDNALIGVYRLNLMEEIDGLMIVRVLDLEYYNGNPEQILDSNEILGLENFSEFNLDFYRRYHNV
ncbi:hypothetical protein R4544_09025 [Acinetobacter baumannii]|nr:hypothetical protein [Acinetobacter baumannii]